MRVTVIGLKRFVGNVDGKAITSGKLYCQVKLDGSRNSANQAAFGFASEELRVDPEIIKRVEHVPLPFVAELETERVSNGKESREVVLDVRPVETVNGRTGELAPVKAPKAA